MKTSLFRIVTLSAICASMIGMTALASAAGPREDRIRAKISALQVKKDRAYAHHHIAKAREIQGQIDELRSRLRHH